MTENYLIDIMLSKPSVQVRIPAETYFKFGNKLCRSNATIAIGVKNDWLYFQTRGETYLATLNPDRNPENIVPDDYQVITQRDNPTSETGFMMLSDLDVGYDRRIIPNGEIVSCETMQIVPNVALTVWKLVSYQLSTNARCENLRYRLEPEFKWDEDDGQVLTMNCQLMHQHIVYIAAGSEVRFGKLRYTLVDEVKLCLANSVVSSNQYDCHYQLGSTEAELCANPFLRAVIIDPDITLWAKYASDVDIPFTISTRVFQERITKCCFYSDNIRIVDSNGNTKRNYSFEWSKRSARENYIKACILKVLQYFDWSENLHQYLALEFTAQTKKNLRAFMAQAYDLAVTCGNLDLMKSLINHQTDLECHFVALQTAVQHSHQDMVQYLCQVSSLSDADAHDLLQQTIALGDITALKFLVSAGVKFQDDFAPYLVLAREKANAEIVEYLQSRPENIHYQYRQVLADMARLQGSFQNLYQLLVDN